MPHIRALFCGPGRVGKTSLGRSILGQLFEKLLDSTIGVELQKIVCTVHRKKDSRVWLWRTEKDEDEQQRLLAKKVLKEEVHDQEAASKAAEIEDTRELSPGNEDGSDGEMHRPSSPTEPSANHDEPRKSVLGFSLKS